MGKKAELRRKRQRRNTTIGILTGFGLFFLLAAVLVLMLNANKSNLETISVVPMKVDYPAPALTLQNIKGNTKSLADFKRQGGAGEQLGNLVPTLQSRDAHTRRVL